MDDISIKFIFNGEILTMQCKKYDIMKDIFKKYALKIDKDINGIYFIYGGDMVNQEAPLSKLAKEKEIVILVLEFNNEEKEKLKLSKDIICPGCKELSILNLKDYKISLFNCINKHFFSNIIFEQFNDLQKINETQILCNKCNNNKRDTYDNKFYKCCNCNINLCPTCKLTHDKNHKIIDYELKNYNCNQHGEKNTFYCNDCNENLCEQCKSSNKHKEIPLNTVLKNEGGNMNKLRLKINDFKNEIKEIIIKFNKVISNLETYYNITNNIINNYNENKKNYQILTSINNINDYNEIIINDIDKIIKEVKLKNKVNNIVDIYEKMIIYNDITLKYNIKKENEISVKKKNK